MAKRVSVKGKGADLFFGEYRPDTAVAVADNLHSSDNGQPLPDSAAEEPQAGMTLADGPADEPLSDTSISPVPADSQGVERDGVIASALASRTVDVHGDQPPVGTRQGDGHPDAHASALASATASNGVSAPAEVIEAIRKTVKSPGREVSFVRLTPDEKARLGEIVYGYKRQGVKTTENEINRIAINYILADFDEHGEGSVLARVIAALRA